METQEYRCPRCGELLVKGELILGTTFLRSIFAGWSYSRLDFLKPGQPRDRWSMLMDQGDTREGWRCESCAVVVVM